MAPFPRPSGVATGGILHLDILSEERCARVAIRRYSADVSGPNRRRMATRRPPPKTSSSVLADGARCRAVSVGGSAT